MTANTLSKKTSILLIIFITVFAIAPSAVLAIVPDAAFTATPVSGDEPLTVSFTKTTPLGDFDTWTWNYGDGATSSEHQNPSHIYTQNGDYTVMLTVTNADGTGSTTGTITVNDTDPAPAFSANPTSGDEPLTVSFTDNSSSYDDIVSWSWDFGDGSAASTDQNPDHTYAQDGTYTVTFTVKEGDGDTVFTTGTIAVTDPGPTTVIHPDPDAGGTVNDDEDQFKLIQLTVSWNDGADARSFNMEMMRVADG